jgi:hypothetical protein
LDAKRHVTKTTMTMEFQLADEETEGVEGR